MTAELAPEITPLSQPYWDALRAGELRCPRCNACGNVWLPVREQCPRCLSADWSWTTTTGRGRIISWVVYRQSMHPAFADKLPYNVAIVELDEGARLITNIVADEAELAIERPVTLAVDHDGDLPLARFALVEGMGA